MMFDMFEREWQYKNGSCALEKVPTVAIHFYDMIDTEVRLMTNVMHLCSVNFDLSD